MPLPLAFQRFTLEGAALTPLPEMSLQPPKTPAHHRQSTPALCRSTFSVRLSPALPLQDSPPEVRDLICSRSCPQHTPRRARHAMGLSKCTHGAWNTEALNEHRRKNGRPAGSFPLHPHTGASPPVLASHTHLGSA